VIALKKVIGRMVQTHYPDNDDKHITDFKKRKSAQNHASQSVKGDGLFSKKLAGFKNWLRVFAVIALGCSFGHFTPKYRPADLVWVINPESEIGKTTCLFLSRRATSSILRNMAVVRPWYFCMNLAAIFAVGTSK
jgi:hypothetical protein